MRTCPFCGKANRYDAATCVDCKRDMPEGGRKEARWRRIASWSGFLSPAISMTPLLLLILWGNTIDGSTAAARLILAAILAIGFDIWAVTAIGASRQEHRGHGVTPLPSGATYFLPTIALLIGLGWLALGFIGLILSESP